MAQRTAHTEPFHSGQQSNAHGKSEKVPVKFKMAQERNIGQPDPLAQALTAPPHIYADTVHFNMHGGKPYSPAGEFGRPTMPHGGSKATDTHFGKSKSGKGTFRGRP